MSRIVGIDIRQHSVQAAVLRTSYRRLFLESLQEVDLRQFDSPALALGALASKIGYTNEAVAISVGGDVAFIHRLQVPPAALKQIGEVVPFELEAQIPVDIEQLVFDSRVLPRSSGDDKIDVLAVAAPIETVRQRIADIAGVLKHEPERVGVGPVPLGNLAQVCPLLNAEQAVAIIDLGEEVSEFVVVHSGTVVFARTLSIGVAGLPDDAPDLVRTLKQTLVSWGTLSDRPVEALFLCGGGAVAVGIVEYLAAYLRLRVEPLPRLDIAPSGAPGFDQIQTERDTPRFAKAIALALSLRAGSKDLNLRQGELSYQRGYGFLKDKVPLLAGLAAALLASFLFASWAESRSLAKENDDLGHAMSLLATEILREETADVERVVELLDTGTKLEKDPQPELDAFELAIVLAEKIPKDFEHDVAELDLQRGHVNLRGVVASTDQAQKIAEALKAKECFKDVKISQINLEAKTNRQKYAMEFDLRCEDAPKKPAAAEGDEG